MSAAPFSSKLAPQCEAQGTVVTNAPRRIGAKTFTDEDQQLFARLSHDRNPMHMDPVAARRLITGRQVVHGIHVLLTALEFWRTDSSRPPASVDCTFNNPVSVGEEVVFTQLDEPGPAWTLEASVEGLVCARIALGASSAAPPASIPGGTAPSAADRDIRVLEACLHPMEEAPEFHQSKHYALRLGTDDLSTFFPQSHGLLGNRGLASTLALSYIVGMVCPGLHSVFSAVRLDLRDEAEGDGLLRFSVLKYDPRFRLFNIPFSGRVTGDIKAFLRPPVQSQPSVRELLRSVVPGEFKGSRSLVIGGSRGLGELTAKILAAGGGETVITYAQGLEDANAVSEDIRASVGSPCRAVRLDLASDRFDAVAIDWNQFDTIYFFATPRIFRKKAGAFDARLFREFNDFYIAKFHALCVFLEQTLTAGKITLYFPSTVFVEERPKGLAEYAMAKAAAEVLVQEINRSFTKLRVSCSRLPRLSTDQTTSIVKVSTGSNLETLLPLIRSLHAG